MRKQILFLVISVFVGVNCYSQITFEKGYFIDETNQKIECLIKNMDWKNNPRNFEYKLSQNEDIIKADIQDVKEFVIDGASKYIRAIVQIDRSGGSLSDMDKGKNPVFGEERLFLKVILEAKASLFLYEDVNLTRFFYRIGDPEIKQLVYKRHLIDENAVAKNNYFRNQLFLALKCQDITMDELGRIDYNKKDLVRLFEKYNECIGSQSVSFEAKHERDLFNLTIRPGLQIRKLSIQNSDDSWNIDFGTNLSFRFGVEAEFILPFNKNKWAVIIEPAYQYYKTEKAVEASNVQGGMLVANIDYKSIELPIGIRYYFFLKNGSKIFANAAYLFDFSSNPSIGFIRTDGSIHSSFDINLRNNQAIGIGYKFKDRYSLEMRYRTGREVLSDYMSWDSDNKTLSILFGYSFF